MKKFISSIPLPISALLLALASLGNLLADFGNGIRYLLGTISFTFYILLSLKFIYFPDLIKEDIKDPIAMCILGAYSLGTLILSTYAMDFNKNLAKAIWIYGLALHIYFAIIFANSFFRNFKLENVYPSWFVIYAGFACIGITGPSHGFFTLAKIGFFIGLIFYLTLIPIVLKRLFTIELSRECKPTLAIMTAPPSLVFTGYMNAFKKLNLTILYIFLIFTITMYTFVILRLPRLISLGFMPSFAGFTFPLVISATGLKTCYENLIIMGKPIGFLKYLVVFEVSIATIITLWVLYKYIVFLFEINIDKEDLWNIKF